MPPVAAVSVSRRGKAPGSERSSRSVRSWAMRRLMSSASVPIGHSSSGLEAQSSAKLSSARWKPRAWPSEPCSEFCVGSTTASKTARPTVFGNKWA
jgi:hypothetical protein